MADKPKRAKRSKPSKRLTTGPTPALLDELEEWISEGKPLRAFCRQEGKPSFRTVYRWMEANDKLSSRIARAREHGFDALAGQCLDLADEEPDLLEKGGYDSGHTNWKKLQIWTRLQLLAKWDPSRYGDKHQVQHGGGISVNVSTGVPREEE